jgi:hypothetical protein
MLDWMHSMMKQNLKNLDAALENFQEAQAKLREARYSLCDTIEVCRRAADAFDKRIQKAAGDTQQAKEDLSDLLILRNGFLLKVAHSVAELEGYQEATQAFERVAASMKEADPGSQTHSTVLAGQASLLTEYYFKAALVALASGNPYQIECALKRYKELSPAFGNTREYALLTDLHKQMVQGDLEEFIDTLCDYKDLFPLDGLDFEKFKHDFEYEETSQSWVCRMMSTAANKVK